MSTTTTSRKKLISFDKYNFDLAQKKYQKHLKICEDIHKELERLLEREVNPKDYTDPLQYYYKTLEASEHNTMKLSGQSIAKLQTKSILKLYDLDKEYRETKVAPPRLDDFSLYAETEPELKRLSSFERLLKEWKQFSEANRLNFLSIANILPYRVAKTPEGNLIPSEVWLKTGKTPLDR